MPKEKKKHSKGSVKNPMKNKKVVKKPSKKRYNKNSNKGKNKEKNKGNNKSQSRNKKQTKKKMKLSDESKDEERSKKMLKFKQKLMSRRNNLTQNNRDQMMGKNRTMNRGQMMGKNRTMNRGQMMGKNRTMNRSQMMGKNKGKKKFKAGFRTGFGVQKSLPPTPQPEKKGMMQKLADLKSPSTGALALGAAGLTAVGAAGLAIANALACDPSILTGEDDLGYDEDCDGVSDQAEEKIAAEAANHTGEYDGEESGLEIGSDVTYDQALRYMEHDISDGHHVIGDLDDHVDCEGSFSDMCINEGHGECNKVFTVEQEVQGTGDPCDYSHGHKEPCSPGDEGAEGCVWYCADMNQECSNGEPVIHDNTIAEDGDFDSECCPEIVHDVERVVEYRTVDVDGDHGGPEDDDVKYCTESDLDCGDGKKLIEGATYMGDEATPDQCCEELDQGDANCGEWEHAGESTGCTGRQTIDPRKHYTTGWDDDDIREHCCIGDDEGLIDCNPGNLNTFVDHWDGCGDGEMAYGNNFNPDDDAADAKEACCDMPAKNFGDPCTGAAREYESGAPEPGDCDPEQNLYCLPQNEDEAAVGHGICSYAAGDQSVSWYGDGEGAQYMQEQADFDGTHAEDIQTLEDKCTGEDAVPCAGASGEYVISGEGVEGDRMSGLEVAQYCIENPPGAGEGCDEEGPVLLNTRGMARDNYHYFGPSPSIPGIPGIEVCDACFNNVQSG